MTDTKHIRNFSIIAHIDHGKSTLADRLLERTGTIEARKMRDQVLDRMDLERERGITIKMQPARMQYKAKDGKEYILNLIDTPGHIDFAYEVSRALSAVEGVVLLVDSTQGIQAQTLTTLGMAQKAGCVIIPVISKIDAQASRPDEVRQELADLLSVDPETVLAVSGRTGEGVEDLLETIIAKVPAPRESEVAVGANAGSGGGASEARATIFDFSYTTHRGIAVYIRVFDGTLKKGMPLTFAAAGKKFTALETGFFMPDETPSDSLGTGEIGYVVTGIKEPGVVAVGDTIMAERSVLGPLEGFERPRPVVWASVYPESQDSLSELRQALERLRLSDSSLSFEEESSGVLGRGFRCGFLGMLHLEIVIERIKRESNLKLIVTIPTISYVVTTKDGKRETVYTPSRFPQWADIQLIEEPWVKITLITPPESLSGLIQLLNDHEGAVQSSNSYLDGRIELIAEMPLRELMRGFFDRVKNVSSGYASLSYEFLDERPADVVRLDILVAEEEVPAFARIVSRRRFQEEGERMVEKLAGILPRQLQVTKIQAQALGRIISSKTLSALRKDVTGYLYGGDVTRRMKLLEKQKKGKKVRAAFGKRVEIPQEVFMKMVQESER